MDFNDKLLSKSAGSFDYIFRVNYRNKYMEFFLDSAKEKVWGFLLLRDMHIPHGLSKEDSAFIKY